MNYYEHHLGDYAKDTAHLTMLEDGAYRRLLDRYYGTEQGIPADQAHRIARARTREEKAAVDAVLEEFFTLDDGVWKNSRAEEEIAKFAAKKPKAEEKRESDKERQRRARERRKALFEELSDLGVHMAWNATTEELHAALNHAKLQPGHGSVTPPVTRDNTATQSPAPSHQSTDTQVVGNQPLVGDTDAGNATRAGSLCKQLRIMGIDAAPHLPAWPDLLDRFTDEQIIAVAQIAKERKPNERIHLHYLVPILNEPPKAPTGTRRAPAPESFDNRDYGQGGRL